MHDEEWDLLLIVAVLLIFIVATAFIIALNMKPDISQVNTLTSQKLKKQSNH